MGKDLHYWITAENSAGQTILIYGSSVSEADATQKAMNIKDLPAYFDVIALPTRDQARASQLLKGHKLERTQSIDESTENLQHTLKRRKDGTNTDGS